MARDFSRRPLDFEAMIREGAGFWRGHNAHLDSMGEFVEENPAAGGLPYFYTRIQVKGVVDA